MAKKDPRIDAYIAAAAPFARPILSFLRQSVHRSCPDVEETLKWRFPHFMYDGILCSMAAFKHHCAFGFWHTAMREALKGDPKAATAMGQLGRITCVEDLPTQAALAKMIKRAMKLNASGVKSPALPKAKKKKPALAVPKDLQAALRKSKKAQATFDELSPSHRREYIEWITEAKREETRAKRLATTLQRLAEGKNMNWKYERKK